MPAVFRSTGLFFGDAIAPYLEQRPDTQHLKGRRKTHSLHSLIVR